MLTRLTVLILAVVALVASASVTQAAANLPPRHVVKDANAPRGVLIDRVIKTATTNSDSRVSCPSDRIVIGGGFKGNKRLSAYLNTRAGNGWKVQLKAKNGANLSHKVYALCVLDTLDIQFVRESILVAAHSENSLSVGCPTNFEVVNGGYAIKPSTSNRFDDVRVLGSYPQGTKWVGSAFNDSSTARKLKVTAVCVDELQTSVDSHYELLPIPAHDTFSVDYTYISACVAGIDLLINVGFEGEEAHRVFRTYPLSAGDSWTISVQNKTDNPASVGFYPQCVRLTP